MLINLRLESLQGYDEITEAFTKYYDLVDTVMFEDERYDETKLPPEPFRSCRFCGKTYNETTFKKAAHVFSEAIGNKDLFSDSECDNCNRFFGIQYENELGPFLGITRTIARTLAKKGIPSFTTPQGDLKGKAYSILGQEMVIISRDDPNNDAIQVNPETGMIKLKTTKNPFIPLKVYKSFLKMALSILPKEEVMKDYRVTCSFLLKNEPIIHTGAILTGYTLPLYFNFPPHAFVFKKRHPEAMVHSYVVALYFQNYIFSIPVLFNRFDIPFYANFLSPLPTYPPFFTQLTNTTNLSAMPFQEDYSSDVPMRGVEENIIIQMNPKDLSKMAAYNGNNDTLNVMPFNPSKIMKIIVPRIDEGIDHKDLYQAISIL